MQIKALFFPFLCCFFLTAGCIHMHAQTPDTLVKCDDMKFAVYVVAINDSTLEYNLGPQTPNAVVSHDPFCEIRFANNTVMELKEYPKYAPKQRVVLHDHIIKADLQQFMFDCIEVNFETKVRHHWSLEAGFGLIGIVGKSFRSSERESSGYLIRFGPRFYPQSKPQKLLLRSVPDMGGLYLKPELAFALHKATSNDEERDRMLTEGAVMLRIGFQGVRSGGLSIDLNLGFGMGVQNYLRRVAPTYTHSNNAGTATDMAFRIGYAF